MHDVRDASPAHNETVVFAGARRLSQLRRSVGNAFPSARTRIRKRSPRTRSSQSTQLKLPSAATCNEARRNVAFLYTGDWSHEFNQFEQGKVPSHRLFGAAELSSWGYTVRTCGWGPVPSSLRRRQFWKVWQALWVAVTQGSTGCIISTTEAPALPLLALRWLGLLRRPVIVFGVSILGPKYLTGIGGFLRRRLLRRADAIVLFASEQVPIAHEWLGIEAGRIRFIPFGIDMTFFAPFNCPVRWDVVAVGTNACKDFPTLVRALQPGTHCLIVTDDYNAAQVLATPTGADVVLKQDMPITQLREEYAAARKVVIPLRDGPVSSGQTVLLEAMAMGRPVVTSDVIAIRDYVIDEAVALVPPHDPRAMATALARDQRPITPAAHASLRNRYSVGQFAGYLAVLCDKFCDNDE